jgi:HK97 family phage portal protein
MGGVTLAEKDVTLRTPYLRRLLNLDEDNEKVTDAYTQSPAVYAAVKAKATNVAQVPFEIFPLGGEQPVETGPIATLFDNVNDNLNQYELWEGIVTYMDLRGHAIVRKDDEERNRIPVTLSLLNPDACDFRIVDGFFAGIDYRRDKHSEPTFVPRDRLILPKYFNPKHPIKGLAPLEAARLGIDNDYQAVLYNREFFKKGSAPGTTYSTDGELSDHQYDRLKEELVESRMGKHHRDLILEGGLKQNPHISQKDMEYLALRKYSLEEIARVFRVPKTELMQYEEINYATALSADLSFWKKTLITLMRLIEAAFNQDFLRDLGYEGRFNVNAIDVLNAEILEKAQAAQTFWMMGWTKNEINERLRLGFPESAELPPPESPEPESPEEEPADVVQEAAKKELPKPISTDMALSSAREVKWHSVVNTLRPTEGRMRREVRSFFKRARQRIYRQLVKGTGENAVVKEIPVEPRSALEWVDDILSDKELRETTRPHLIEAAGLGFDSVDVDVPFARDAREAVDERILAAVAGRVTKIGRVNETIREDVKQAIRQAIADGIEQGLPMDQRAAMVLDAVGHQLDNAESRVNTIARTETFGAFSEGRREVYRIAKPLGLRWITARDDRVRHSHEMVDGKTVRWGGDQAFANGMLDVHLPGPDVDDPAAETINCRCVTVPIFNEDELDG